MSVSFLKKTRISTCCKGRLIVSLEEKMKRLGAALTVSILHLISFMRNSWNGHRKYMKESLESRKLSEDRRTRDRQDREMEECDKKAQMCQTILELQNRFQGLLLIVFLDHWMKSNSYKLEEKY